MVVVPKVAPHGVAHIAVIEFEALEQRRGSGSFFWLRIARAQQKIFEHGGGVFSDAVASFALHRVK